MSRRIDPEGPGCFFVAAGFAFFLWLAFWATVAFVAIHFIGKYW